MPAAGTTPTRQPTPIVPGGTTPAQRAPRDDAPASRDTATPGTIPTQRARTTRTPAAPTRATEARTTLTGTAAATATAATSTAATATTVAVLAPTAPVAPIAPGLAGTGSSGPDHAAPAAPARRRGVGRAVAITALCVGVVGAVAAGIVLQLQADARATAWQHAQERVAAEYAAQQVDEAFFVQARTAVVDARYDALVADAVQRAQTVLTGARSAADASPHGGDENLAALRAAADAIESASSKAGTGTSPAALVTSVAAVAAPQKAAVDTQAAWQAAEDARIAAERAAAEQAAAEAAQRAAARASAPRSGGGAATARPRGGSPAAAPAAAAPAATAWAAGVQAYGVGGLGASLNAARADAGLPTLSVTGSTTLQNHAAAMAAAGSIWHSGSDHIVGWVQPASDSQMIQAYLNSPGHRAWILKEGKSTVSIGAVTINGRLYTAMRFS